MAGLRTATDIEADYIAVRAAWLLSLQAEAYTQADTGQSRSVTRAKTETLHKQMIALDAEYKAVSRGGIQVRGISTRA